MTVEREFGGETWYVEARHYPTSLMAKRAWERAESKLILGPGDEGIGVTRLAPNPGENTIPSGLDESMHAVVVVTRDLRSMEKAKRLLSDGTPWDPVDAFCDALIARRTRMLQGRLAYTLSQRPGGGKVTIRRPEERGARVYESGEVREPRPGRG